ncbi:PREDICTED: poly [ADP-ribose] polymerase 4 [Chinchilla lanigera]|uniref:poly [ADP-ribose] polymerase 4 n=1 Tax=Chinchilla lanigera TaxID=34839 RepID=UPI000698C1A3|nr:PREDICTED: poly [ADP-ribose] polymerase 4 [Chinchilla lanigera]
MTVGIFANCTFCLKVKYLPLQQKRKLQTDIKENGGKLSSSLNPQCTHVILDNADVLSQYQLQHFQKKHILLARPDFIWECVKARRLLGVDCCGPAEPQAVMPPAAQKTSHPEVKTDGLSLDSVPEEEVVEITELYAESVEIPPFSQEFEVAKYNTLERVGVDRGRETVVVELQCAQEPGDCPFLISAHFLVADSMQTRRQAAAKNTAADASEYYENYIEVLKKQGFLLREHFTPEATQLASEKLQALLLEEVMHSSTLSQEVSDLVEMIWAETQGHLEHTLLKPVNKISLNDVSKAEGILLLVKTALKNGEPAEQLQKMMAEFYRLIPHRHAAARDISLGLLAQKEDLCQLIRDMLNVCETHLFKRNPPSLAKYRALRCKIEHVEQNTEEFFRIRKELLQNNHSETSVDILQIFSIGRVNEATEFLSKLGNVRSLLHGSPVRNIVGILSRGLLLPKVVEDRGVQRTDVGNLGSGIYFSDSLGTSIKYSHPGETDGSRLLVICDVALGRCVDLFKKDFSLTAAPLGYDSVHGVSATASVPTDFEDDEFAVYKTNQIKVKYIIKFCMPGDQIKDFHPHDNSKLEEYIPESSDTSKVENYQIPDLKPSNVKAGLQDASGNLVPLEGVHIKGKIIDFVAQVVVFQTYTNQSCVPIEAKYVFPLDDKAAVCGFEAFINGRHIVGKIKEKEEARQQYRAAISQGHGAYLMDQDAPDVFTVSVGNLPPQAKVLMKITYITELSIRGPVAVFFMPATVAPWQQEKALNENLQDAVEKICIKEIGTEQSFSLTVSIEMPYVIDFISSDTHTLKQKCTDCRAVISTVEGSALDSNGFSLHIGLRDAYLPRMWVEKHPEKESEACMLVFQPDLDATLPGPANRNEVVICLDCSNSMEGVTFTQAKQIALYALSLVSEEHKVNVIQFGTGYKELFSYPKHIMSNSVPTEFIKSATPTMGNTDFWKTLRYLGLMYPSQGVRNVLLISDGHLQNEGLTLKLVKRNVLHTRLFTCGVSPTANRHVLRNLSQCGAGVFEYFNSKSKHSWKKQVEDQMNRLRSPSCRSVSVRWQQLSAGVQEPLQAPAQVPSLFHNDRLLVYGWVSHCTQATLCALIQEKEFCSMVSTTELQKTTGTMIHKLAARALIRDFEDGILHEDEANHEMKKQMMKSLIIKLSKENSLITQFTSFVAVEKRDGSESPFSNAPNVLELVDDEDVDFLPYLKWQEQQEPADTIQPLSAPPEWSEEPPSKGLTTRRLKSSGRRRLRLSMLEVSEDFEEMGLGPQGVAQPVTLEPQSGDVENLLSLTQMDSSEQEEFNIQSKTARSKQKSAFTSFFAPPPPPTPGAPPPPPTPGAPPPPPTPGASCSLSFPPPNVLPQSFGSPEPPRQLGLPKSGQGLELDTGAIFSLPKPPVFHSGRTSLTGSLGSTQFDPCKFYSHSENNLFPVPNSALGFSTPPTPPPLNLTVRAEADGLRGPRSPSVTQSSLFAQSAHSSLADLLEEASSDRFDRTAPYSLHEDLWDVPSCESYVESCVPKALCLRSTKAKGKNIEGSSFGTESDETPASALACRFLKERKKRKVMSSFTSSSPLQDEGGTVPQPSGRSSVLCAAVFSLQTQDGFWKLTPELGQILNLNTHVLHAFLEQKGIRSLGIKGRECLLDLIATLLVLQFLRTKFQQDIIVFKSLMKLDDPSLSRNIPWDFEAIKKASEWVRRMEGQYPSICQRLELGENWDLATKHLLGIQPPASTSPLHRVLYSDQA